MTNEQVRKFLMEGPRVTHLLLFGGSPCQGASGANVAAKGAADDRAKLLDAFLRIKELVLEVCPQMVVKVCVENVASMVAHGRETLRWFNSKKWGEFTLEDLQRVFGWSQKAEILLD